MKLGILGTGTIVETLLSEFRDAGEPLAEEVYLLSTLRSLEKAQGMVASYHLNGVTCDYGELLRSDIDTVYVALPNHLHYTYAKQALLAGKHVILEKPAVPRKRELQELWELARARDLVLVEAVPLRHRAGYEALKEGIREIGAPRLITCYYCQRSRRYDDFLAGRIHPVFDPEKCGGALMDLNLYNIHALVGLFGAPRRVSYHASVERGIDVSGVLTLDYGSFQAAAFGSKCCASPEDSVFMGEEGILETDLRWLNDYILTDLYGDSERFSLTGDIPRMRKEFSVFRQMIERHDRGQTEQLMQSSLIVADILETARKQAGIQFPGD